VSVLELDRRLLVLARTRGHSPRRDRLIGGYAKTGEHAACWLALGTAGALLDGRDGSRRRWRRGVRVVGGAYGLNYAVKLTVRRRRPVLPDLPPLTSTVSTLSFPSAHATSSFAAAFAFRDLAPGTALYAAAIAFGLSRPYLGVHYPSDVVIGAALGTLIAARWPECR
jgi:undecaprenyl-diphosphatase